MRNARQKIAADRFLWRPLNTSIVPPLAINIALMILIVGSVLYLSAN